MLSLICPVCREALIKENPRLYRCSKNHCFDIAKQGYVNLFQSYQSKNKRHGDDKLMIKARTDFLDRGYYAPLRELICTLLDKHLVDNASILDAGCGDCYYTSEIFNFLSEKNVNITGVDISKDALIGASKRNKNITLAVSSVFSIPVADNSCNAVLNIFSPLAVDEYRRILKNDGIFLRVIPLENHLFGLKSAVYDTPYKNPEEDINYDGFTLLEKQDLKYCITLKSNEDIINLFKMTPYYYKTSRADQQKLESLSTLETEIEFSVLIYEKA